MKNTGEKLKAARESQRVSINEVSMATKISPRMIQAIEAGDVNALPAKTFLRGFVQSYASYLKLDVDELLEVFHEEMGSTLPESRQTEANPTVEDKEEKKTPPLLHERGIWPKVVGGTVILLLVFIIIGVKNIVEKYEKEADTAPAPTDITSIQSPEPSVSPESNNTETQNKNPQMNSNTPTTEDTAPGKTPETQSTPEIIAEKPTPPAPSKKAPDLEKKPDPKPKLETTPEPITEVQPKPIEPKPTPKSKNEIIVEALDVVEIEFRVGNGDLKRVTLKPDQIHTIKALGPVTLDLSDGGAVNLIHNGRDKGVPGDLGKPKKIKIQ